MRSDLMAAALLLAVLVMMVALVRHTYGTECETHPGHGKWVYRIVEEKRCWFPADGLRRGREKSLSELHWQQPQPAEITNPTRLPWEQEHRWQGAQPGWEHKE